MGIYSGPLGFGYNTELIAKKKLPVPKTWADLLNPAYKGEIQVANPASSGTAYTMVATLVQLMGEDKAFDYMKKLHANIGQYTRSGTGPIKAVARGETTVSISFVHDGPGEKMQGFPVETITPADGTGAEIGSMSIIKGARNLEAAKKGSPPFGTDFFLERNGQPILLSQVAAVGFDVTLEEIVPPLLAGGCVVLRDPQELATLHGLQRALAEEATQEAERIWDTINGPNLAQNIAPTRSRATNSLRRGGSQIAIPNMPSSRSKTRSPHCS